jgi:hypothetical protein
MKDIINREIKRNFGNWELLSEWGRYGDGYEYGDGDGDGKGNLLGYGFGYEYGDFNGNGESRIR